MPKFRKKPVVIEATQWFRNGDHPLDGDPPTEGKLVRYFRRPDIDGYSACKHCSNVMHDHGWIDTLEGGHIVCPGDWIVTGVAGENYPCKPDIFEATYNPADDDPASEVHRLRTDAFREGALWFSGTMGPVASRITVNEAAQRYADSFLANKAA